MECKVKILMFESASCKLTIWPESKSASLSSLFAMRRQQGHATHVMKLACEYADVHGITMYLTAHRYGHPIGPGNPVLIRFYQKLGFEIVRREGTGAFMKREPRDLQGL